MGWSKDEASSLKKAGYQESSSDPNKMINGNHWVKKDGESNIFNTSRHNSYGSMSSTDFNNRLKK
ncbi:hypothetical protein [Mucilaginibacter polytrichastri]|uniref:Novel toxin 21 domain-containing protein n=1 Tax=Mucilaginibacter polytrichastri TaxID=1302689 RepID=A0A1Q6A2I5_9SPHI|nr:hypothetical protein [Mucilaginibacter polytrichastri]OKS88182.1 hypothetical protein RG47T_3646 [Mucilaginibacter polytrichastri]SFT08776.1 hypothetical protein SAMN04487890_11058 [Mucilaginibacter polytrichastri]